MFDKSQFVLDYVDSFQQPTGYQHEIIIPLDDFDVMLVAEAYAYPTKQDWLFGLIADGAGADEIDNLNNRVPDSEVIDVRFMYDSKVHPTQLHMQQRAYILNRFIPCLRQFMESGIAGLKPSANQTIGAKNAGRKVFDNLTEKSNDDGQRQRGLLAKRLGLGDMDDFGWSIRQPL